MKKSLHSKKLQLSRETLRNLETTQMSEVAGASAKCTTLLCTGGSNCYACTSIDASQCTCD
ncbi:MAG TPA: class I lanthipeptide [Thermoanaerobaculia bacterium]|jgi:hypothetical protein|nr:class I lanthipeptide [Thermoanaerobaculia bacterium]